MTGKKDNKKKDKRDRLEEAAATDPRIAGVTIKGQKPRFIKPKYAE